ncbi:Bikaverin cluster transcription factor bik5 [Paramyrothecium foliicola]|nr:Bikaverin cluster transcription factor bik5 [Paramyrothecium foliicola]
MVWPIAVNILTKEPTVSLLVAFCLHAPKLHALVRLSSSGGLPYGTSGCPTTDRPIVSHQIKLESERLSQIQTQVQIRSIVRVGVSMGADERPVKVLSCASCRARKIKCSKVQPRCSECDRADIQCIYPSRKPTRRAPRPRQKELLDRISRLEGIVGRVESTGLPQTQAVDTPATYTTSSGPDPPSNSEERPLSHAPGARYLSSEFWDHLCEEVEALKQTLEQSSGDDEDDIDFDASASQDSLTGSRNSPSGYVFGNPDYHEREPLAHPSPEITLRLWAMYCRNCDPLMKILHRPTMDEKIRAVIQADRSHRPSPQLDALLFCIYFGAVASLSPEVCQKEFGASLNVLSGRYRILAERALAAADYLNANDLTTIQAFAIYVCMLRCQSHGRTTWSLTALLVRLAQAMNLHRDGDGHRFSIFEAEMRRRLWGFILILDIRCSEDRGTDNIVLAKSFNTPPPTPIDDADFSPSSTAPLIPKATPADNVINYCMVTCSSIFGLFTHQPSKTEDPSDHTVTESELIEHVRHLENNFVHSSDPTHLPSLYASDVARVVILKLWLAIQYPFTSPLPIVRPIVSRETLLRTALSVMELSERAQLPPWKDRFSWWTYTYVQWHPLAVTLAELCLRTEGELVDRAWEVVERVFPLWRERIADTARGNLWRPIKKLMKKARAAREAAIMKRLSLNEVAQSAVPTEPATAATSSSSNDFAFMESAEPQTLPLASTYPGLDDMDTILPMTVPDDLTSLYMSQPAYIGQDIDFTLWNEFLMDTQQDGSPDGSGDSV